jgi:cell division protein FtsI/penicillin-binding protein 2
MNVIASGGKMVEPHVVERIEEVKIAQYEPRSADIGKSSVEIIRDALRLVVNGKRGTGFYARSEEVVISGKTGTAQNPLGKSHAWFSGFAPYGKPKICLVVFLEHGGKGGLEPARFAKQIIEEAKRMELL